VSPRLRARLGGGRHGTGARCASVARVSASPVLEVSGLTRRYGDLEALRGLDLELAPGECVAVIGHNGSGKTTAMRMIAGLLDPSAGSVSVDGSLVGDEVQGVAARAALAMIPDTAALYDDLSVREHLELVALAHGDADDSLDERIETLLDLLALADKADARPGQLSRGMRQKAQLACALIRPSLVLVLDEPVVGLDPAAQRTLRELLREAKRAGRAVLLTTHQLEFARGIADRAVLLSDGEVVAAGPYEEIVDGPLVREYGLL
jgi:ABC-2 type transport system ATP-binding protein